MKKNWNRNGLTALVLMLAVLLCAWAAAEEIPENAQDLVLDQEMTASVGENEPAYFRFVPEETAVYDFCSLNESYAQGSLYQEEEGELQWLTGNSYWDGEETDFRISRILMEGETYYFAASLEDPEEIGSFPVMLTRNTETALRANAVGQSQVSVKPEESVTLRVAALGGDGDLTYCWMRQGEVMTDQTTDVCTVESVTDATQVDCSISDQNGNEVSVTFYIDIDNGFSAEADGAKELAVAPDTPVTLTVKAKWDKGAVTYQWYEPGYNEETGDDYSPVAGATESSYTVQAVNMPVEYNCLVRDDYGNSSYVTFCLSVDNGFSAEADGESFVKAQPGESVTLKVNAVCNKGGLTYQWQEYMYDNDEGEEIPKSIEGATEAAYTVNEAVNSQHYFCVVNDEYGNIKTVEFFIGIDNGFYAEADGDESLTVAAGETATFRVTAGCHKGKLSYQWHVMQVDEENGDYQYYVPIEGETGTSFTTPEINSYAKYLCIVTNEYSGDEEVYFYVYVENGFYAEAEGDVYRPTVPGETAALTVKAVCDKGGLSYTWYDPDGTEIEGETGPSYTTPIINEAGDYSCRVSDDYGNSEHIYFYISLENGFTAAADGPVSLKVRPDETVSVNWKVKASAREGELHYQWYKNYEWLEDVTGASFTEEIKGEELLSGNIEYYCDIWDDYGNRESLMFEVQLDNGFAASAAGPIQINVKRGETATLKVYAQAIAGAIQYNWFRIQRDEGYERIPIPDAEGASYTTDGIQCYSEYLCEVRDEHGGYQGIMFYISIDNGLSMKAEGPAEIMVHPGESATMKVSAKANEGEITYQWYKREYQDRSVYFTDQPITGETSTSLTVENVQSYTEYSCHATDVYGTLEVVDFKVGVDNDFIAKADGPLTVTVKAGEPLTLKIIAKAKEGEITYQWYQQNLTNQGYYDMKKLEGATEAVYTAERVDRHTLYFCDVRDSYGTMTRVAYRVNIDNGFTAEADGPDQVTGAVGDTVTLKVRVSAKEGDIIYRWYERKYEETGNTYSYTDSFISGGTGDSITVEVTGLRREMICRVEDSYNNYAEILFVIDAEKTLTAGPEGSSVITVNPGETATLKVRAEAGAGEIQYNWYKLNYIRGAYTLTKVSGAENSNTYTTEALYQSTQYQCHVRDQFDNEKTVYFMVSAGGTPELQLNVPTQAEIAAGGNYALFSFVPRESRSYRIQSSGSDDTFVTLFDGSGSGDWLPIEKDDDGGRDQNFGLNADLEAGHTYYYAVSFYSGWKTGTISFRIREYNEDNGFSASADGPSELSVPSGETAVLKVTAEADDPEGITYEWRKQQDGEAEGNYTVIEGADGPSCETEEILSPVRYSCLVTDAYGHQKEVIFTVEIHIHTLKAHARVEAACTEAGTEAYWECEGCGRLFSDEKAETEIEAPAAIEKKGHTLTAHEKADSTCTEAGTEAYWTCDVCEKLFSDEEAKNEIEAPVVIAKKPHTLTAHAKKDSTCTETGTEAYWTCGVCEKLFSDEKAKNELEASVVIAKKAHTLTAHAKKDSTCTETGTEAYWTCDVCEKLFSDEKAETEIEEPIVIGKKTHTLKAHAKVDSTCTETGMEAYWICDVCEKLFSDEEAKNEIEAPVVIAKKPHTLTAHAKVDSTCTVVGTEAYWTCGVCGKLFADEKAENEIEAPVEIAKKPHTLTAHTKVDPTCTETGTEAYWTCGVCEKLFSDGKAENEIEAPVVIAATGHDWNEAKFSWAEDNSTVMAVVVCKNDPSHWETEIVGLTCRILSPTEDEKGSAVYTSEEFKEHECDIQTRNVEIPALKDMSVIRLPDMLTAIEEQAFEGLACEAVIVPDGCKSIGRYAFRDCMKLKYVRVPEGIDIDPDAFDGCNNVVVDRIPE